MVPPSHSRISRYHSWLTSRPVAVLAGAVVVAALAAALASRLQLRTSFAELLPSDDPAVEALSEPRRVGDLNLLLIGIRSPDHAANLRYAEALTERCARCRRRSSTWWPTTSATCSSFFSEHVAATSRRRTSRRSAIGCAGRSAAQEPDGRVARRRRRRRRLRSGCGKTASTIASRAALPDGYGVHGDVRLGAGAAAGRPVRRERGRGAGARRRRAVAAHPPATFHPAMRVRARGRWWSAIENRRAIEQDILGVTIFCPVIIALSIVLYFRGCAPSRWWAPGGVGHRDRVRAAASWSSATSTRRRRSWARSSSATASTTRSSCCRATRRTARAAPSPATRCRCALARTGAADAGRGAGGVGGVRAR